MNRNKEFYTDLASSFDGSVLGETDDGDVLTVDITNPKKWNANIPKLLPLFGQTIYEEYEGGSLYDMANPEVLTKTIYQLEMSLKGINRLLVALNSLKIAGYAGLEFYKSRRTAFIRDILINRNSRGKGLGKRLYEQIFKDRETKAIIGYTKTPESAHLRLELAKKFGMEGFFADMEIGREEVMKLQRLTLEHMKGEGILVDRTAPCGFAFLNGMQNVLSPIKKEEVKFSPSHPLHPVFQRLIALQDTCPEHTAVGLLVTFSSNGR